jgi:hypothetical protein
MMKEIIELRDEIKSTGKQTFSRIEILGMLSTKENLAANRMKKFQELIGANFAFTSPKFRPETLEIGDITQIHISGIPHPAVVFKVEGDLCWAICCSTQADKPSTFKPIEGSRFLKTGYWTNTVLAMTVEHALSVWDGVFDDKKQLDRIVKDLRYYYNQILK